MFGDLYFENFDFFMLFKNLRIESFMIGGLIHPVSQLLDLLLFLRQFDLRCADH